MNSMKSLIQAIFGTYTPQEYLVDVYDSAGNFITTNHIIPDGFGGVDWEYVLGVLGFFVVVYCILRIIGGVINRV